MVDVLSDLSKHCSGTGQKTQEWIGSHARIQRSKILRLIDSPPTLGRADVRIPGGLNLRGCKQANARIRVDPEPKTQRYH